MAGGVSSSSEEEILLQVQGLVSDSLAVVSYKWLSRNFSLSSNVAKRLLQNFAKQNENSDLQIVYAISGWSKKEPQSYIIQLAPKPKLEEVKAALLDSPSIHVYSVQRSLPKDPAQLYSPDFVQAEQLFNESAEINNCLRDNRFSAVTCELVHRLPTTRKSRVTSPPPPVSGGADKAPLPSTKPVPKAPVPSTPGTSVPPKNSDATPKAKDDGSAEKKPAKSSISPKTPHAEPKDSTAPGTGGKRKSPATASIAVSGGTNANSLASMWGKAPAKKAAPSKTAAPATKASSPPVTAASAGDAEARIKALEAEDGSEDDMVKEFTSMRRGQMVNGGAGRRRRMIVNDADDDDDGAECEETVIRLESPESPKKGRPGVVAAAAATRDTRLKKEGALQTSVQGKSPSPDEESLKVRGKPVKSEPNSRPDLDSRSKASNKDNAPEVQAQSAAASVPDTARVGSKRKKVLKTRIDERGREVTEVVWEGDEKENVEKDKAQGGKPAAPSLKQNATEPPIAKPQAAQKPSTGASKPAASKAGSKASAKSAAGKPAKGQGNIMSFFKKK